MGVVLLAGPININDDVVVVITFRRASAVVISTGQCDKNDDPVLVNSSKMTTMR